MQDSICIAVITLEVMVVVFIIKFYIIRLWRVIDE